MKRSLLYPIGVVSGSSIQYYRSLFMSESRIGGISAKFAVQIYSAISATHHPKLSAFMRRTNNHNDAQLMANNKIKYPTYRLTDIIISGTFLTKT